MKLLYVVNEAQFFISHRLPLGLEAQAQGHKVVVVSAGDTGESQFVEAAAEVAKSHPDWQFWLLGGVDPGNPSAFATAELVDIEREFGVTWLGHRDDVAHILQQSHVVCFPSYREGAPKVLLEASAIGRAMIASNIAGCREVVTEGVTGLLVEPRDSEGLARAMKLLGEDDELRARCSRAARERAEAVFTVVDVVDHTFRVYAELLNT